MRTSRALLFLAVELCEGAGTNFTDLVSTDCSESVDAQTQTTVHFDMNYWDVFTFQLVRNFKRNAFSVLATSFEQRYDSILLKTAAAA